MARWHIGKDNWFLVIPAAILGLVALYTVNRMYRAGDIRRAIEVVTTYQVGTAPPLGQFLAARDGGDLACSARVLSEFYGTLDVFCSASSTRVPYHWRVHVGQRAFAPGDRPTKRLMHNYAPEIFGPADAGESE
jgi:hypothetical protein